MITISESVLDGMGLVKPFAGDTSANQLEGFPRCQNTATLDLSDWRKTWTTRETYFGFVSNPSIEAARMSS